jgi:chorismate mutase
MGKEELSELRAAIEALDAELVRLVGRRRALGVGYKDVVHQ